MNIKITALIKNISDTVLRDVFKQHEFGDVILPFIVLRRLDTYLEDKKEKIIKKYHECLKKGANPDKVITHFFKIPFYNYSSFDLLGLRSDPANIEKNFKKYLKSFSSNVSDIIHNFKIEDKINTLVENDLLFNLIDKFAGIDLSIKSISNHKMGQIYEELIRYYSELYDEESGNHFTPRDIVRLLVSLVFDHDKKNLEGKNLVRSIYDPCCGTGGMLTIGKQWILENINSELIINLYGQEKYDISYAICKSDFLITGENPENIKKTKSTLSDDKFSDHKFHYMLVNPPFGTKWEKDQNAVEKEIQDPNGRFKWGRPNIEDGTLLFVQEMVHKMNPEGCRVGFISNYSPFFTGMPTHEAKLSRSCESNIRRGLLEGDLVELIVQLPDRMFFNTGISTFLWILNNKKTSARKGKVQLIDASTFFNHLHQNLGEKGKIISEDNRKKILDIYREFKENNFSKIFENNFFGYKKITLYKFAKDKNNSIIKDKKDRPIINKEFKIEEKIPLNKKIEEYLKEEVDPYIKDYNYDKKKVLTGYQIDFIRYFYEFNTIRPVNKIKEELDVINKKIQEGFKID
jgi:type I restriction enzyme M protein